MTLYRSMVSAVPLPVRTAIKALLPKSAPKLENARNAASMVGIKAAKVLVVGANDGGDCKQFIKLGAKEVHGLDVLEDVGSAFTHPRVVYHRQSIEGTDLPSGSFDLVYSFATMEHVPDIAAGYAEMARLVKHGGAIYSVASPLWFSPFGHHMACFSSHPWIHVALTEPEILDYARENAIRGQPGTPIEGTVAYMMDQTFFNKRRASEYTTAIDQLSGLRIEENQLFEESRNLLAHSFGRRALELGHAPHDLLSATHRVIATSR